MAPMRHEGLALRVDAHVEAPLVPVAQGEAQLGDAARRRVAMVARVLRRLRELVDDGLRRGQVRVAHAEVDDVLAAPARLGLHVVDDAEDVGRQTVDAAKLHAGPLLELDGPRPDGVLKCISMHDASGSRKAGAARARAGRPRGRVASRRIAGTPPATSGGRRAPPRPRSQAARRSPTCSSRSASACTCQLLFVYAHRTSAPRASRSACSTRSCSRRPPLGNIPGAWAAHRFRLKPVIVAVWWLTVPAALCFASRRRWPWLIPGLLSERLLHGQQPGLQGLHLPQVGARARGAQHHPRLRHRIPPASSSRRSLGGYLAAARRHARRVLDQRRPVRRCRRSAASRSSATRPTTPPDEPWSLAHPARATGASAATSASSWSASSPSTSASPSSTPTSRRSIDQGFQRRSASTRRWPRSAPPCSPSLGGRIADLRGAARRRRARASSCLLAGPLLLLARLGAAALGRGACSCAAPSTPSASSPPASWATRSATIPLAWGYAIFDTVMGLPMVGGAILGGVLYRAAASPCRSSVVIARGRRAARRPVVSPVHAGTGQRACARRRSERADAEPHRRRRRRPTPRQRRPGGARRRSVNCRPVTPVRLVW